MVATEVSSKMTEVGQMPTDWQLSSLGKLFEAQQGKAMSAESRSGPVQRPFLRTSNILWGKIHLPSVDKMHFTDKEVRKFALQPGDLLVCEGGEVGRAAIWDNELPGCLYQNHIHRLRRIGRNVESKFVMYWLQDALLHRNIYEGAANRTTIPNLFAARLKEFAIPLPCPEEQRAIAAVLSKIQAAAETQGKIVAALKELKAATMGRLFCQGTRQEKTRDTAVGRIPKSWKVVRLGEVAEEIRYGTSVRCLAEATGRPVLRIPNVIHGRVQLDDLKYAELSDAEIGRLALRQGDLLFVRTNGNREYTGRCAVYSGLPEKALFASYLLRVRLRPKTLLPEFVHAFLMAGGREQIVANARPAADGKFNINTGTLEQVLLPAPPSTEQQDTARIDRLLADRLTLAEGMRARMDGLFSSALHGLMAGQIRLGGRQDAR